MDLLGHAVFLTGVVSFGWAVTRAAYDFLGHHAVSAAPSAARKAGDLTRSR